MLQVLKKKRLYEQAMSIAGDHPDGTPEVVAALEAEYAAFLFTACEPEASMQHYINTIGCGPLCLFFSLFYILFFFSIQHDRVRPTLPVYSD